VDVISVMCRVQVLTEYYAQAYTGYPFYLFCVTVLEFLGLLEIVWTEWMIVLEAQ
jgi:hypothetical protein